MRVNLYKFWCFVFFTLHLPFGTKLEKPKKEEWKLPDRKVPGVICLTLTKDVDFNVTKETITTGMMKVMSNMFEKLVANNKIHLVKKPFNLKMIEGATNGEHLNYFNTIVNILISLEI